VDPNDASGPLDVSRVELGQRGRGMSFQVWTRGRPPLGQLQLLPKPGDATARFACLRLLQASSRATAELCAGAGGKHAKLGYQVVAPNGNVRRSARLDARVLRPTKHSFLVRFNPLDANLSPHRYRWHVLTQWSGAVCPPPAPKRGRHAKAPPAAPCRDIVPNHHVARFHLRPIRPVGCADSGPSPVYNGPRNRKRVALTFDDGPSSYTPQVLSILHHHHIHGTFFEIGQEIPGRTSTVKSIIDSGNELGDHSLHHETDPGYDSIRTTQRLIKSASGFKPCLFRPPGGSFNSSVVSAARSLGMTTVIWDVDPRDWSEPGSGAIYSIVTSNVRPGSIVLMHDGGGNRSQTVAALGPIIDNLRSRGYHCVTVSHLLGQRIRWAPVH
jgi:peptidoglycan/xylan/chitin deacetylase (PgdA/CDA1 family)